MMREEGRNLGNGLGRGCSGVSIDAFEWVCTALVG
jgi:hypothetical protein